MLLNDAPRLVAAVRLMALFVVLASAVSIYAHVVANYDAGRSTGATPRRGTPCPSSRAGGTR